MDKFERRVRSIVPLTIGSVGFIALAYIPFIQTAPITLEETVLVGILTLISSYMVLRGIGTFIGRIQPPKDENIEAIIESRRLQKKQKARMKKLKARMAVIKADIDRDRGIYRDENSK